MVNASEVNLEDTSIDYVLSFTQTFGPWDRIKINDTFVTVNDDKTLSGYLEYTGVFGK